MSQKMTVFGVGEKIAAVGIPYIGLAVYLHYRLAPVFTIRAVPGPLLTAAGIVLVTMGLALNFGSAFMMLAAFKRKKLLTTGPYAVFRNPMYASFILLTIPGLSLWLHSWLVWTGSIVVYLALRVFIKGEEGWLEEQFGEAYRRYREKVWCKFL